MIDDVIGRDRVFVWRSLAPESPEACALPAVPLFAFSERWPLEVQGLKEYLFANGLPPCRA